MARTAKGFGQGRAYKYRGTQTLSIPSCTVLRATSINSDVHIEPDMSAGMKHITSDVDGRCSPIRIER